MIEDERIDFERAVVQYASDLAIDQLCDVMHVASERLRQMKYSIDPAHKFNRKHCPKHLHELGKSFARATVESMIDEPPISFRAITREVLEGDEMLVNEDAVIDQVREHVLLQLIRVVR